MTPTVASAVVDSLARAGVREVFGVAGGALTPLLHALHHHPTLTYTGVRHEAAAAHMAAATAHATGRPAACLGEQGPGTLNLVSGLGSAYLNRLPLTALTVSATGKGSLMALDATLASAAVTTWRHAARSPADAITATREALRQAVSARPGPTHVDIPRHILAAPAPDIPAPQVIEEEPTTELGDAVATLLNADRLLVIAGGGAFRAQSLVRKVVDRLGAAAAGTQMGIGVVPSDGDTFIGHGGVIGGPALIRATEEADVILAVGCRFSSWWWQHGQRLGQQATLIQVDTDPALKPTLPGDVSTVLTRLSGDLPSRAPNSWVRGLRTDYLAYRRELDSLADLPGHPAGLARLVGGALSDSDLVVLDGGHTSFWGNDFTPAREGRRVFHEPGMAQLGFGMPYANALALAYPERRVVLVTGDGAVGFAIAELDTARRLGLRTITVVHDNASWGVIGLAQRQAGFSLGTDLSGTDYAAVARGFGCLGIRVEELADFPAAYREALAADRPALLDVVVRFAAHPMMPAFVRTTTPV